VFFTLFYVKIEDLQDLLQNLFLLPTLETLALNGNPVCKRHNYKNLLVSSLPKLKILDGKMISQEERIQAEVSLRKEKGLLDLMLSNYCELIKLNSVILSLISREFPLFSMGFQWDFNGISMGHWVFSV